MREINVPTGCAAREEWIDDVVEGLAVDWHNGARNHVFHELMRMPKEVAIAVAAGLCSTVVDTEQFYHGMKERA